MKHPKLHKDEIQWLLSVYGSVEDDELKNEAYMQLRTFGLNDAEIQKLNKRQLDEQSDHAFQKAWKIQLERNRTVSYSLREKVVVFLFGPYKLLRSFESELISLWKDNYKVLFRQRMILLLAGLLFWVGLFYGSMYYVEYLRIKEIEQVDISEWERSRQVQVIDSIHGGGGGSK